jgi:hypothetical protein
MTLILSGTDGLSDVDGSAATPAIRGTDANTGIFFPAADTIAFSEGGVESMRVTADGNLGLGTDSPANYSNYRNLAIRGTTGGNIDMLSGSTKVGNIFNDASAFYLWNSIAGGLSLGTNNAERMRIDSSGNVGIGTSSPAARLDLQGSVGTSTPLLILRNNSAANASNIVQAQFFAGNTFGGVEQIASIAALNPNAGANNGGALVLSTSANGTATTPTERMRIDSSGNLLVGTTSAALSTNTFFKAGGAGQPVLYLFKNSVANTDQAFCVANGVAGGTVSFQVLASGNAQNTNNSYGAISDAKLKENIVDATPKLEKLNQVRIVNFNMIGDEQKQIGVIAQELEQIFPGMVEESPDYEEVTTTDEDGNETTERVATGTTTKSVKYSVFVPMLIKALQEQQAIITQLQADVAALKGTP